MIMDPDEWDEREYDWLKVDDRYMRLTGRNAFHDVRVYKYDYNKSEYTTIVSACRNDAMYYSISMLFFVRRTFRKRSFLISILLFFLSFIKYTKYIFIARLTLRIYLLVRIVYGL